MLVKRPVGETGLAISKLPLVFGPFCWANILDIKWPEEWQNASVQ